MFRHWYFAELYEVIDGRMELSGSKITGVLFWKSPVYAYNQLAKSGKLPVGMRRIK